MQNTLSLDVLFYQESWKCLGVFLNKNITFPVSEKNPDLLHCLEIQAFSIYTKLKPPPQMI